MPIDVTELKMEKQSGLENRGRLKFSATCLSPAWLFDWLCRRTSTGPFDSTQGRILGVWHA